MYKRIKELADEAIALQNKDRMDAVLREISDIAAKLIAEPLRGLSQADIAVLLPNSGEVVQRLAAQDSSFGVPYDPTGETQVPINETPEGNATAGMVAARPGADSDGIIRSATNPIRAIVSTNESTVAMAADFADKLAAAKPGDVVLPDGDETKAAPPAAKPAKKGAK